MEPYSLEEFTKKINKSIKILMYLWEVQGDRTLKPKVLNIQPNVWDKGATVYFEVEFSFETKDPDIGSFKYFLDKLDNKVYSFFSKIILQPNAEFKYFSSKQPMDHDDMVGLFMGAKFEWLGHENENNSSAVFGFEYNLFYDEYEQYHGN